MRVITTHPEEKSKEFFRELSPNEVSSIPPECIRGSSVSFNCDRHPNYTTGFVLETLKAGVFDVSDTGDKTLGPFSYTLQVNSEIKYVEQMP
jgi:hypothetical protein